MANQLRMAKVHTILTLRGQGWSFRRIGRELGIRRETVSRYVRLAEAQAGQETAAGRADSKPAKPAPRVDPSKPAERAPRVDGPPPAQRAPGVDPAGPAEPTPSARAT